MNIYVAHARILHKEPPKVAGRSGLMVLKVGRDKEDTGALIQTINQVIIRIPPHLSDRAENMAIDSYIEVFGHVGGIVRRSPVDGRQHLSSELVAANIQPAIPNPNGEEEDFERLLFNRWISVGLLRGVNEPKRKNLPSTAYVQIGRDRVDRGLNFQHSGVAPMLAYGNQIERMREFSKGDALHLEGRVIGLLRRIPMPGAEGEYESVLDAGLVIERSYRTALVAQRLMEPERRPNGTPTEAEADEAPEVDEVAESIPSETAPAAAAEQT